MSIANYKLRFVICWLSISYNWYYHSRFCTTILRIIFRSLIKKAIWRIKVHFFVSKM